jgi:hypothetical protein
MKNSVYEDIKMRFIRECLENNIQWTDALLYMIYSEYPIGVINPELGSLNQVKKDLEMEYETLWNMQPSLEEDEDKAFAIQHARDIYDVLLGREGGYYGE